MKIINWTSRMLSEDGEPSTKRVLVMSSVFVCLLLCCWQVWFHGLDAAAIDLAKATLLATFGNYVGGKVAERIGTNTEDK